MDKSKHRQWIQNNISSLFQKDFIRSKLEINTNIILNPLFVFWFIHFSTNFFTSYGIYKIYHYLYIYMGREEEIYIYVTVI